MRDRMCGLQMALCAATNSCSPISIGEYSDPIFTIDCRCYIAHFSFRQWNLPGCNAELPTLDGLMTPLTSSRMVRDA